MAFDDNLADRVREHLALFPKLHINEKRMFGGLAFMVNGKMCVNVSGDRLMCRFDPELQDALSKKRGYEMMVMKGKEMKGYGYVQPEGLKTKADLTFWVDFCLDFNDRAKASKG